MMPTELARSSYVSLVTYRRDGTAAATPVWAAPDGEELLVWTREDSYKVKRLRRDDRATATVCDVRGRIPEDARPVEGRGRLLETSEELDRVRMALARKYGWRFRLVEGGGALLRRGKRPHVGVALRF